MEALVPWRSFDLPLDFKGTKKTAAFIGSIQDEITLEQVTEQLGELAPQAETIDVTIVKCVQGADLSFHCLRENGCGSSGGRSEENEFCKTAPELSGACKTPAAAGRRACKGKGGD